MEYSEQKLIWDKIAKPWHNFRKDPLPHVNKFLKDKKGKILDLCCGSGRNFQLIKGEIYGIDFSEKMLEFAKKTTKDLKKKPILKQSDAEKIPFQDNFFDSAIFIAGLHCIKTPKKRFSSLKELHRVLKPNAKALITVWSKNHKRINKKEGNIEVPWTIKDQKHQRYYYIYSKEELKNLLKNTGFRILKIEENDNILVEIEKI